MKVNLSFEINIDEENLTAKSTFMKILRILGKTEECQIQWVEECRNKLLQEAKVKRSEYAKKMYKARKAKAKAEAEVMNPTLIIPSFNPPANHILTFD